MRGPTPKYYLGFGSTWTTLDSAITWTEVTSYVLSERGAGGSRGRSSELDDMRAGTFQFVLNSSDRRFDPTHTAGPYYGDLLPGVPVKVTGTANGTEYPVFRGFVGGWPQDYDLSNKLAYVNVNCTDGMAKLATAGTPSSVYAIEVEADSPRAWWRLSETAGETMADSSGNDFDGTYTAGTTALADRHPNQWETVTAINFDGEYRPAPVDDAAQLLSGRPTTIEFLVRTDKFPVGQGCNGNAFLYRGATFACTCELFIQEDEWSFQFFPATAAGITNNLMLTGLLERTGVTHHVAMRLPAAGDPVIYIDGVNATGSASTFAAFTPGSRFVVAGEYFASSDAALEPNPLRAPFADLAVYTTDIGTTRLAAHVAALTAPWDGDTTGARIDRILGFGWPSDLIDTATGFTTLGPATLGKNQLQLIKGYEKAEQGRFFISRAGKATFLDRYYNQLVAAGSTSQATFSDDGSDNRYCAIAFDYDDRQVYNRIRSSRTGGSDIEVYDQTSIDTYGEQVDSSLTNLDLGTDAEARSLAELRLDRYKDPSLRVRPLELKLHGMTAAQQADVLDLELGYRVTVERTPQAVGSQIAQETVVEGISHRISGGQWTTTLTLSPVDAREYGLWGDNWDEALWGY